MLERFKKVFAGLICVCILAGCGSQEIVSEMEEAPQDPEIISWFTGETVAVQYEIPKVRSYIMVDQWGYLPNSEKKFFCEDITEETEFQVVGLNSREVVYSGVLKKTEDDHTYVGYFSQVTTPGIYTIQTKYLGESYPFTISENVYDKELQALVAAMKNSDWSGKLEESCMAINSLLLAYELNPSAFLSEKTEEGIPEVLDICLTGVKSVLAYQNHKTGAVFSEVVNDTEEAVDGDNNLTAVYIGTAAKFCYSYKEYDATEATELLKYATLGWQYIGKDLEAVKLDRLFFAASEMYRVTTQYKYKTAIKDHFPESGRIISTGNYDFAFFANISYLMTSAKVEVDYCNRAIDSMIREATKITEESKSELYLVRDSSTESAILKDAALIVFASRVNYNQEYMTVLENHLHYLSGMNKENYNFFVEEDSWVSSSDCGKSMTILAYSLLMS